MARNIRLRLHRALQKEALWVGFCFSNNRTIFGEFFVLQLSSLPYIEFFLNIYRRLPKVLQKDFWFTTSVSFFVAIFELAVALAVSLFGVALATPDSVANFGPIEKIVHIFPVLSSVINDQRKLLVFLLFGIVLLLAGKFILNLYMYWRQARYGQRVARYINYTLFEGYLYSSYLWHTKQETAELQSHLVWRERVAGFMLYTLQFFTYIMVTLVLLLGILITSPLIGIFVLGCTGSVAFYLFRWSRKRAHELNTEIAAIQLEINNITLPALQGIREVLIYRQQAEFLRMSDDLMRKVKTLQPKFDILPPMPSLALELMGMLMLCVSVVIMNVYGVSLAQMVATLTLMAAVAWRLLPIMNRFLTSIILAQQTIPFVMPVLARIDEIQKRDDRAAIEAPPCPLHKDFSLQQVHFRYPETEIAKSDAIQNITLTIAKGSKVGFVGTSGAGKSTLIGLFTGLFAPTSGNIYIDGVPMTDELRAGWMQRIGYVPQATFLLNATIAQNVAFSDWGKEINEERVKACCHMAAMHFIEDLAEGIHTVIGERGIRLSGGQVQRVSVARALYNAPHTLIFDEATSALDGGSEREIMQMIEGLDDQITVIIIAHRLSTVEKCDYIYWMQDGKIYKEGKAEDILNEYAAFLDTSSNTA